jgi:hypothetical protein
VVVPPSSLQSNALNALTAALPATPKGKLGVGVVWISPGAPRPGEADVDEYITTPEGEVLSYKNTDSASGHYFRDVRSAGSNLGAANDDWQSAWEFAELRDLNDIEAAKLKLSLNLYRGSGGPVHGLVQVARGAKRATHSFKFDSPIGNEGLDAERPGPCWVEIDVATLIKQLAIAN